MTFNELIALLGGFSAVVAAIAWLARSVISQVLSRDVERYKAHLSDLTEQFKSELAREAKEHEVRFTALHDKRRTAIEELYVQLADAVATHRTIGFIARVDPDDLQRTVDKTLDDVTRLREQFAKYRIYFDRDLADQIESVLERLQKPVMLLATQLLNSEDEARVAELLNEIENGDADAGVLQNVVESRFRELLGVHVDPTVR